MTTALEPTDKDFEQMMQMLTGCWVTQIAGALASYSIADHLANGPATAEQIATIDPRALRSARKWQLLRRWRRDRNVWHRRDVIARIIV
jgi:hypothetical protein